MATDVPWSSGAVKSNDQFFTPYFTYGSYDPLGGGAFITTPTPWSERRAIDASSVIPAIPPTPVTLSERIRVFLTELSYQSPHRQDASLYVITPATFGGVSPPVPMERQRFFWHEWAWHNGPTYPFDASWFAPPQSWIKIPPPPPTSHGRKVPLYLRRLQMLYLRSPNEEA